jgi:hypothetical protein
MSYELEVQTDLVEAMLKPDPPKTESEAEKARLLVKSQCKGRSPEAMAVMREAGAAAGKVANEKKALEREAHTKEMKARILKAEQEAKAIAPDAEFDEEEEEEEEEEVVVVKPKRVTKKVKKVAPVVESDDEEDDGRALKQYIKEKAKKYAVKYGGKPAEPSTLMKDAARNQLRSQLSDQVMKAAWANVSSTKSLLYALCIMKRVKVQGLPNEEIKIRTYPPIRVEEGLPDLSFLGAVVAQRGSGKTNALIRLIQHYDATAAFEKVIFFCPSWVTDRKYQVLQESENYDLEVYIKFSEKIFKEVLAKIQADMKLWWAYEKEFEAWRKYLRVGKDEKKLTAEEQAILEKTDYEKPDPPNNWKKAPATLIVWDDMGGNRAVYNNTAKGALHEFTVLHRHWHCSLIHVVQHYHSAVGKQIRNNLSMLMLFSNKKKASRSRLPLSSRVS